MEIAQATVTIPGLDVAYLTCGPKDGPLALCLHGFPDSPWGWRHLLPVLGRAGYRAVAPFLRGYAPTTVPADGRYQTGALVADAIALHEVLGGDDEAIIIGHDWGAIATYGAAAFAPDRWSRVVAAAVPPSPALGAHFLTYDQLQRSWYMFFFQSPLADIAVAMGDLAFLDRLWDDWSPGYPATEDVAHVKDCLRQPANLAAAIGYYRAQFDPTNHAESLAAEQAATSAPLPQPTLYLHGKNDGCIGVEVADEQLVLSHLGPGSRMEVIDGAGHFLQLEQPDAVNALILEFIGS